MNKLVTVIIPTYNRCRRVVEAVESVLAQTYPLIEVIVVDDGSTDGTEAALQPYAGRIRYLSQRNGGPAAARNLGIREASGQYIALLDSDDLWAPTKIEKQVALIEQSPKTGVVFSEATVMDLRLGTSRLLSHPEELRGDIQRKLLWKNHVLPTSSVLARRECFDTVGLFDETLGQAEDWELWMRISRQFTFDFVPEPLVSYRFHNGSVSSNLLALHPYEIKVVERAFREDPVDGSNRVLRRRILAWYHWATGADYLWAARYSMALRHLLHSLMLWPFERREAAFLLRAPLSHVLTAAKATGPGRWYVRRRGKDSCRLATATAGERHDS
jgi:glycosyltransferase involved in cell wall biosynthesis